MSFRKTKSRVKGKIGCHMECCFLCVTEKENRTGEKKSHLFVRRKKWLPFIPCLDQVLLSHPKHTDWGGGRGCWERTLQCPSILSQRRPLGEKEYQNFTSVICRVAASTDTRCPELLLRPPGWREPYGMRWYMEFWHKPLTLDTTGTQIQFVLIYLVL